MRTVKFTLGDDVTEYEGHTPDDPETDKGYSIPFFTRDQLEKAFSPCHVTYIVIDVEDNLHYLVVINFGQGES